MTYRWPIGAVYEPVDLRLEVLLTVVTPVRRCAAALRMRAQPWPRVGLTRCGGGAAVAVRGDGGNSTTRRSSTPRSTPP